MTTRRRRTMTTTTSGILTTTTTNRSRRFLPYLRSHRRAAELANENATVPSVPSCIDLTLDDEEVFVDLTSIGDQSPIVLSSSRQTAIERAERIRGLSVLLEYDRTDEVNPRESESIRKTETNAEQKSKVSDMVGSSENEESPTSTTKELVCPICLDSLVRIRAKKKELKSTICGHIFCSECIDQAFLCQKSCPTCRKKLSSRMIHPIFI